MGRTNQLNIRSRSLDRQRQLRQANRSTTGITLHLARGIADPMRSTQRTRSTARRGGQLPIHEPALSHDLETQRRRSCELCPLLRKALALLSLIHI